MSDNTRNDLEKIFKDVVHGSIGAVATVIEAGSGLAKSFVEKGQEIAADLKQAADEACEASKADPGVDVRRLTPLQRETLRRQLDEVDAEDRAAKEAPEEAPQASDAAKESEKEPDEDRP